MTDFKDFKGKAKRLEDLDIPRIGYTIGVGEDELHAFMDTETSGSGFDSQGRPKILFEPHVFYRNLKGAELTAAVKAGLAYKKWGEKPYPKESYTRLKKAMAINENAALKAASWGLGQILGENYSLVGYPTPQAMVFAFMEDEEHHLEAVVKFLISTGIDDDLRNLAALKRPTTPADCIPIVRVYNGSQYAKNDYHTKFAKNHNKWRKIPDTPWTPGSGDTPPHEEPHALTPIAAAVVAPVPERVPVVPVSDEVYTDKTTVEIVQRKLYDLGFTEVGSKQPDGSFDGKVGKLTNAAILAFKNENDILPLNADINRALLAALDSAEPRNLVRGNASPATVRENVPEVKTNWMNKILATIGVGGFGASAIGDSVLKNVSTWRDAFSDIPSWVWLAAGAVIFGLILYNSQRGERKGVEAYQSGERR